MVPAPAPSGGAYMSKYSPYGVEEPLRHVQEEQPMMDQEETYYDGNDYGDAGGRVEGGVGLESSR